MLLLQIVCRVSMLACFGSVICGIRKSTFDVFSGYVSFLTLLVVQSYSKCLNISSLNTRHTIMSTVHIWMRELCCKSCYILLSCHIWHTFCTFMYCMWTPYSTRVLLLIRFHWIPLFLDVSFPFPGIIYRINLFLESMIPWNSS